MRVGNFPRSEHKSPSGSSSEVMIIPPKVNHSSRLLKGSHCGSTIQPACQGYQSDQSRFPFLTWLIEENCTSGLNSLRIAATDFEVVITLGSTKVKKNSRTENFTNCFDQNSSTEGKLLEVPWALGHLCLVYLLDIFKALHTVHPKPTWRQLSSHYSMRLKNPYCVLNKMNCRLQNTHPLLCQICTPSSVPAARKDCVTMSWSKLSAVRTSSQQTSIRPKRQSVVHSQWILSQVSPQGPMTWGRLGKTGTPSSTATRTFPMWMPLAKYSKAPCTNRSHNLSIAIPSFTACSSVYCSQRETMPNNFALVRKEQNWKIQIPNSIRFLVRTLSESRPFRFAIPKVFVGKQGRLGSSAQTSGESNESNKQQTSEQKTEQLISSAGWILFDGIFPFAQVPHPPQPRSASSKSLLHSLGLLSINTSKCAAWYEMPGFLLGKWGQGQGEPILSFINVSPPGSLWGKVSIPFAFLHTDPVCQSPRTAQSREALGEPDINPNNQISKMAIEMCGLIALMMLRHKFKDAGMALPLSEFSTTSTPSPPVAWSQANHQCQHCQWCTSTSLQNTFLEVCHLSAMESLCSQLTKEGTLLLPSEKPAADSENDKSNPCDMPLYWLVHRDPYVGLLNSR